MKILSLLGSPKKNGNTAGVLSSFEEKAKLAGHDIERIHISSMNIKPCLGCVSCQKNPNDPDCVIDDDAEAIFNKMFAADAIIYATPLYCWSFTGMMSAFLDRHISLVNGFVMGRHTSLIEGKKIALLVTCGGPVENNADIIQMLFERMSVFTKTKCAGKYILPGCLSPETIDQKEADKLTNRMIAEICYL